MSHFMRQGVKNTRNSLYILASSSDGQLRAIMRLIKKYILITVGIVRVVIICDVTVIHELDPLIVVLVKVIMD